MVGLYVSSRYPWVMGMEMSMCPWINWKRVANLRGTKNEGQNFIKWKWGRFCVQKKINYNDKSSYPGQERARDVGVDTHSRIEKSLRGLILLLCVLCLRQIICDVHGLARM